jgi:hypothetical protein
MRALLPLLALLLISCGGRDIILQPGGTSAAVTLADGRTQPVELLALRDTVLLCAADSVIALPLSRIASVRLRNTDSGDWITPVVLCQALPSVVLLASKGVNKEYGMLGLAITAVTFASFAATEPRELFKRPWSGKDAAALRLHMRYPEGLSDAQLAGLRRSFTPRPR